MNAKNRIGLRMYDSVFLSHLAAAHLDVGDVANAEATLCEALGFVEESGVPF
jgi:hypothetical protein